MRYDLEGKRAIVTGASKGIGRSIALGLAEQGAHLAICARGREQLEVTAGELEQHGIEVFGEECDVGNKEALESFLEKAHEALGKVQILINNASALAIDDNEQSYESGFQIDVMAPVRASWKVAPWMAEAGGGSIIHISSVAGIGASNIAVPYGAVKAAMISHGASLAAKVAPQNIRVNVIAPGPIEFPGGSWDFIKQAITEYYDKTVASHPFKRLGRPEEVADVALFLASDASSWMTGQTFVVDGGQSLTLD